jgi:hydrogenase maturation protein HypF
MAATGARRRVRARVTGTVQGVGFRPFVYRLAQQRALAGWVLNDVDGVLLEVEGDGPEVERFLDAIESQAPPLARVESLRGEELLPTGEAGFEIVASEASGEPRAPVSADAATCDDCLRELFDPGDRRYRYPFVNCTNCGPRFTIVRGVPYDRALTTMAGFAMCEQCQAEHEDPFDRRFHAQPNACPVCGPAATLLDRNGEPVDSPDAVAAAVEALLAGRIVAIKGLGGYHLACRADDDDAVAPLRSRKHREEKPFALIAPSVEAASELVELGDMERELLEQRARPIVLAPRLAMAKVAQSVAPRSRELGVMLPYTPLHHLLLADAGMPLVLTSGNVSDEPIAFRDEDALTRLAGIADLFLVHDRPIETRTDDSVVRAVEAGGRRPLLLRRSRGYVPESIELPLRSERQVVACGAELKNTFALAKEARAWVGHHIGDLKNFETLESFREGIAHFERLFAVQPELCAHDLHPQYLSTRYALEREGVETIGVQHHHAHFAACLAEHGELGRAVGAIYDGTGYGTDATIWGGELLLGDLTGFDRVGSLWPLRIPGGEAAIREPWRMACAWLAEALEDPEPVPPSPLAGIVGGRDWRNCSRVLSDRQASPVTTSAGRLFDAIGALCGAPAVATYEGQAAVELEAMADSAERGGYQMPLAPGGREEGPIGVLDPRSAITELVAELEAGVSAARVAARFHNGLSAATAAACVAAASDAGVGTVVLSGGVFQNRLLLEQTTRLLDEAGLRVLVPERLPPNDGGISYGQLAVAAATRAT